MIGIVDYNMGNLGSVKNAFEKVGAKAELVSKPEKLSDYDRIVLPGVGAFGDAMEALRSNHMDQAIVEFAKSGKPLMGTCLGMQLLFETSEEFGDHVGLGLIPGKVVAFDKNRFDHPLKVPHMGWNEVFAVSSEQLAVSSESSAEQIQKEKQWKMEDGRSVLFNGLPNEFYLYFVHSYHAVCDDKHIIGKSYYGYEFVSAVQRDNIYGIQPHPEKSHDIGLKIIENFTNL